MFAVLLAPDFQLQAILRQRGASPAQAAALLDEAETASSKLRGKAPVLQASPAALRAGVRPGMTATQAQARCLGLALYYRQALIEDQAQAELLDIAAQFTPDYESTAPGVITLDWGGLRAAPEGCSAVRQTLLPGFETAATTSAPGVDTVLHQTGARLHRQASSTGLIVRVGVAENPDLAFLAACLADPVQVLDGDAARTRAFLAPLPLAVLSPPLAMLETLHLWGIRTLREFTALPRDEITRRLGADAARLWDCASGTSRRLLRLVRMPDHYAQKLELEHGIETLEPLMHLLRRMLETLTARLASAWLVAREIVLTLGFENGSVHRGELRLAEPARDIELLLRLLHAHMEGFTAPTPVMAVALELKPARPGQDQIDLFAHSLRDPNRFAETLAQLEVLLGPGNVGAPVLLPTHRPDSVRVVPYLDGAKEAAGAEDEGDACAVPSMPLRRFRPPLRAHVVLKNQHPVEIIAGPIHGIVLAHRGPWLLSGDWWDKGRWAQEEWDVQLADGLLCRLKREQSTWSLEGLYA